MPAIRVAGCQLPVSSDDFVFAAVGSIFLRVAVIASLGVSISLLSSSPWERPSLLGDALLVDMFVNGAGLVLDIWLGTSSGTGTIPDLDRRVCVKHLVLSRLVGFGLDMIAAVFLAVAAVNHAVVDASTVPDVEELDLLARAVAAVSCTFSLLQLCGITPILAGSRCHRGAEPKPIPGSPHAALPEEERLSREAAQRWQSRCNTLWCCCSHGGDRTDTLDRVGEVMAAVLGPSSRLGLTPTDFAAGLALVRMRQKISGVSSDPEAALNRDTEFYDGLPGALPLVVGAAVSPGPDVPSTVRDRAKTEQLSHSHVTSSLAEPGAATLSRDRQHSLAEPGTATISSDKGDVEAGSMASGGNQVRLDSVRSDLGETAHAEIQEAAAWSHHAVAAYGCLLYSYMHISCGCCWLAGATIMDGCCTDRSGHCLPCACCFRSCRTDENGRVKRPVGAAETTGSAELVRVGGSGGICGCDAAAARMASGLPRSELVSLSFQGSVERRPFLVLRDPTRRAVVIAIRGTMSLSDCVADADASPVNIKPWMRRWGLLGRRGAAALATGSSLQAHRAMWVGALNIVAELARIGVLERADERTSSSAAPETSGEVATAASDALEGADSELTPALSSTTTTSGRVCVPIIINRAVNIPRPSPAECHGSELHFVVTPSSLHAEPAAHTDTETVGHSKSAVPATHTPEAWRVVVVGHSLGAGVATLVGLALSGRYPGVQVKAYSPPGGLVSTALAEALKGTVTSFVLGKDMIPRLSLASARRLQHQILMELRGARVSKARLLASLWGAGCVGGIQHAVNTCCRSQCCSGDQGASASFGCPKWVCCGSCSVDASKHLAPLTNPDQATQLYGLHHLQSERSGTVGESVSPSASPPDGDIHDKDEHMPSAAASTDAPPMVRQASALSQAAIAEALASTAGFASAIDRAMEEEDTTSMGGNDSETEIAASSAAEPLLQSVRLIGLRPGSALPRMRMAGTIVHLDRLRGDEQRQQQRSRLESGVSDIVIRRGCSSARPKQYTASNRSRDSFRDLVVSTLMVRDHMPDKIMRVLDRVAEHRE